MATTVFPVDHYGVPSYDELVIVAQRERMQSDQDYREEVRPFVTGLAKATSWARKHPAAAVAIMQQTRALVTTAVRSPESVPATLKLLQTSRLDPAAWTAFGTWMWSHGLLDVKPDGAALVTQP